MEKQLLDKAIQMCEYANKKFNGVLKENFTFRVERTAYHYVEFGYHCSGDQKGAYIAWGDHGGSYSRIFADKVTNYGGWSSGKALIYHKTGDQYIGGNPSREAPSHIFREDMVRPTILQWDEIKQAIDQAIQKEQIIDNFQVDKELNFAPHFPNLNQRYLFRGKERDSGKWIVGFYLQTPLDNTIMVPGPKPYYGLQNYTVDPKTVGQFTGLRDAQENCIYEGDVISVKPPYDEKFKDVNPVIFKNGMFGIQNADRPTEFCPIAQLYKVYGNDTKITVVGNIHDNPDLAEKKAMQVSKATSMKKKQVSRKPDKGPKIKW